MIGQEKFAKRGERMDVLTILISIFVFGIIILFHEFGHFIVAKSGILVEEFAIGMGPKFISKRLVKQYILYVFSSWRLLQMLGKILL